MAYLGVKSLEPVYKYGDIVKDRGDDQISTFLTT